ncbi:hypothetical protein A6R68_20813 [Neotoma lepida]|uniref:Large ribosomal subunit protein eL36 n=1 Tax=Neotoma lepida TaxID=56216 RepID=A0A1A6HRV5_NEOLE|nr:hypothetical protein A6R68_20813 [Neotoma lepida]
MSKDKRVFRFIKERTGTHIPAKRKQEELSNVLAAPVQNMGCSPSPAPQSRFPSSDLGFLECRTNAPEPHLTEISGSLDDAMLITCPSLPRYHFSGSKFTWYCLPIRKC